MITVSIHDAKTNLSKYIAAAKNGKKVFIGSFGEPEVVLTKIPRTKAAANKARDFSALKGLAEELPDSFSEETDKQVQDMMLGNA